MKYRTSAAINIRDRALQMLRDHGTPTRIGNVGNLYELQLGDLFLLLGMPHSKIGFHSEKFGEPVELSTREAPTLPYGLDIWAGPKVLNIEWSSNYICLRSFRRGTWECAFVETTSNEVI